ncbi:glycosyltransferase family 1 protein [Stackebrandtia albiflava]
MVSEHSNPLASLGESGAGGQNLFVAELSAALTRSGCEVTVYTRRDDPAQPVRVVADAGYRVVHVPAGPATRLPKEELPPYMPRFTRWLRNDWRRRRPDLVHAHFWMSGLAALSATRGLGVPVLQSFHALGVVKRRHFGRADASPPQRIPGERHIGHHATGVVASCSSEAAELTAMGVSPERLSVVPCGVDTDLFRPGRGHGEPRRFRHRLVAVGRLVPHKGFEKSIRVLAQLPDTELVIAGGPPEAELAADPEARRLRAVALRHGVADRVRFVGQTDRDRLPGLLCDADLLLCTPWYESFGIVPLEAMACGVPVVAEAVGGLTDSVEDQVTGLLVPGGRVEDLALAVTRLSRDPATRNRMGRSGRQRVLSRYTWDRVARETLAVYRRSRPASPDLVATGSPG